MSQAYYRKWRPRGWDEIIGQDHVVRTLRNAVSQGNITHAYLFSGPRGTGKTTTARVIAKAVNCLDEDAAKHPCNQCENCRAMNEGRFLDLIEIDAASNTGVDDVRDLREKINFSPSMGKYKVYIIDEVHMLSNAAFNALLKTLEEPPGHAIFILATTEVYKIPATVLSRCQRHEFRRIPVNFIQAQLKEIADKEGITVEPAALTLIARQATGSMRDAISLLDQLASTGADVTLELTKEVLGTATHLNVMEVIEALLNENAGAGIAAINRTLDAGSDARQFGRQVVDALRSVLMVKMGNAAQLDITTEEAQAFKGYADRFDLHKLLATINLFDRAVQHAHVGWQPGLQLELALAQAITSSEEVQAVKSEAKAVDLKSAKSTSQGEISHRTVHKKNSASFQASAENVLSDFSPNKAETKEGAAESRADEQREKQPIQNNKSGLDVIKDSWRDIRAKAKQISPETGALLNSCRTVEIVKGKLVLGFTGEVLCSKMENGRNLDNARAAVKAVTGEDVIIECCLINSTASMLSEEEDIEKGGMVSAALSLGGKITKKEKTEK